MPIAGYTAQSDDIIKTVNENKQLEETVLKQLDALKARTDVDQRWLAIGRTHVEEAFMAINRALFKPQRLP
jgi:hypothetical protein